MRRQLKWHLATAPKRRNEMENVRELPAVFIPLDFLAQGFLMRHIFNSPEQVAVVNFLLTPGRTLASIDDAKKFRGTFAMFPHRWSETSMSRDDKMQSTRNDFGGYGLECSIRSCQRQESGTGWLLKIYGERKVSLLAAKTQKPQFAIVKVAEVSDSGAEPSKIIFLRRAIEGQTKKLVECGVFKSKDAATEKEFMAQIAECVNQSNISFFADGLIYLFRMFLENDLTKKVLQGLFKELDVVKRLEALRDILSKKVLEIEAEEKAAKIAREAQEKAAKVTREQELRARKKEIQLELGEDEEEADEFAGRIQKAGMPPEVEQVARKQLRRLKSAGEHHHEATTIRTYLDWLCDVPWNKRSDDIFELDRARQILDEDHYDLEKIKKRIVEYIAVRKLNRNKKGPILCLVGPPGVGKTSVGKSFARALDRKFVRISLGGVKDEAEIRGHRRTYVGALPGRIIQGMKKAGTVNPVFMIDEIDKLSRDFRGDPSAALLEALDFENNNEFSDHYLEVPYDLSQVIFVCTANSMGPVSPPLQDRMEVLHLHGYTRQEKFQIARRFLIPKQLEEHGVTGKDVAVADDALGAIIDSYTSEAGVRNMEREIASVIRSRAVFIAQNKPYKTEIEAGDLLEILGPERFEICHGIDIHVPGVVTGLAWTESGGDTLIIESCKMSRVGKEEELKYTGHLGPVMQESVQVAWDIARRYLIERGKDLSFLQNTRVHLHCPEGATPKDGPSAGAAMTLAFISLLSGRTVRRDLAMTGEITPRGGGTILPVGGIKEKLLAAHRAGCKHVFIPKKNEGKLSEIPDEIKSGLNIMLAETIDDIVKFALL